jgi:cathepsin L
LAIAVNALTDLEYQTSFTAWMRQHGKSYAHEEFLARYDTYRNNLAYINSHNAKKDSTFTLAMNQFGDLTSQQFAALYNGLRVPANFTRKGKVQEYDAQVHAPASIDWVKRGAVTGVKNQGQCGSCWSFSTTGSTEGCHFLTTGSLVSLSEQDLVDCSTAYGNQGCNGGLMDDAFQYIIANHGIDTEASYPYSATGPNQCQYAASNCGSTMARYTDVASGSEDALEQAVAGAPVSVAIDASQASFQFYSGGVYYEPACSSSQLDHGVLAAGYGTYQGSDFWLVKNSWGTGWGISGYIMMSRNKGNNCGIATMASYPSTCGRC